MEIFFYSLEDPTVTCVKFLGRLLERALERSWRCAVACSDIEQAQALDRSLWTHRSEGFIPHGLCGEDYEEEQPILLMGGCFDAVKNADVFFGINCAPDISFVFEAGLFRRFVFLCERDASLDTKALQNIVREGEKRGQEIVFWPRRDSFNFINAQ